MAVAQKLQPHDHLPGVRATEQVDERLRSVFQAVAERLVGLKGAILQPFDGALKELGGQVVVIAHKRPAQN